MLFNEQGIYCFYCNKYYSIDPFEVFLNVLYDGSISCPKDHLIGNQNDKNWFLKFEACSYYYEYHNEGQCRCIQDKCNCNGYEENCENKLGRKSYEKDLEDKI